MARTVTAQRKILNTALSWTLAIIIFFPIFWILVLSFKTEGDAIRTPIEVLTSAWTLESYSIVQERSDYLKHFTNSVIIALGSTVLGIIIGVPAAWSMAFRPIKTYQRYFDVDALNKDASCGRRSLPYLSDIY